MGVTAAFPTTCHRPLLYADRPVVLAIDDRTLKRLHSTTTTRYSLQLCACRASLCMQSIGTVACTPSLAADPLAFSVCCHLGFSGAFRLHTPGIRSLCTYKYSQVGELPASLKHRSSLYTQCLEVGLAGRITTVLGKKKGEEREIPLYGTGLLDLIPFRNQCLSFHHNTRVNSPMKLLLDDTMTIENRDQNADMVNTA